ncbi:multi-sensor signal transduction multi-kinase [Calothrix sp. NIES-4101]|nr:multi-sensor signal transduction multi-kinase [Calothrix sp. NIES-4101]
MNTANQTPIIPGYKISEQLYAGSRTLVYRGIREKDSLAVVLKFLTSDYPSFNELLQFRNQYTITKNLNIPGILQPLSLEAYGNGYILVMEDMGEISLKEYFTAHSLTLSEFLAIAIQLTDILHHLYQNRVIHKDIKPANILIHPESKQVRLIDFSIASLLPRETQEIKSANVLEGTLAYISPEQTGRMNRGVDYRSDFYSLGVTFFQLLTGELPFSSVDAMELVHCHIAQIPASVADIKKDIPEVISEIINKLMAKNAEDRYQSALGLKHDLENCLYELKDTGKITYFEIGKRDICDRFIIPEKLYGRETEIEQLLAAFTRVSQGERELMLVAGFSGIGKTAIVNEVHKPIVQQRGYFIKGKFDQFNRNIPFSAFVQAFRHLMGQLLSESDAQLSSWKDKILQAVGENGQVIIDVIPELERIIGVQPSAPELSGTAAQNRFNLLFQKFIQIFTQSQHPLVMFLDDLQWADSASLNLIQLLMVESETGYLLMIGAYRDNEVFAAHPFMLTLDAVNKTRIKVSTITLKPLSQNSLNHLVADTLNSTISLVQPLTELVYQKTQGNPFFATQFLKALYQDKLITFDTQARYWQCDIARVREAALTDDVVEFMATQLQKLPEATQNILKIAACIGNQFDLNTLAIAAEKSTIETATALWTVQQEGLILSQSEIYKFYVGDGGHNIRTEVQIAQYKFLHDRVQQAAYSLIAEDCKQITHLKIGRLLRDSTINNQQQENIFEILNQINIGITLISDSTEQEQVAKLNLLAGRKAKQATAYTASTQYFQAGIELLSSTSWEDRYSLTFDLYQQLAEVEFLNGNFEQSDILVEQALKKVTVPVDRARLYNLLIIRYTFSADYHKAIEIGRKALSLLGEVLPESDLQAALNVEFEQVQEKLGNREISSLIDGDRIQVIEKKVAIEVLKNIDPPAYFVDLPLYSVIVARSVNLSLQYGNAPESPKGFSTYGLLRGAMFEDYYNGLEFGNLALNLSEQLNNPSQKCQVCVIVGGFLNHWVKHLKESDTTLNEGYQVGLECGDIQFAGYSLIFKALHLFFVSTNLESLLDKISPLLQFAHKTQNQWAIDGITACEIISLNLSGKTNDRHHFANAVLDEEIYLKTTKVNGSSSWLGTYLIIKSKVHYLYGDFQLGLESSQEAEQYLTFIVGHYSVAEHNFSTSLNLIAICRESLSTEEQSTCLEKVYKNQAQLQKWSEACPSNFLHKYELIQAEILQLTGVKIEAIALYDRAISGAKENDYIQEEALANELAAKFYLNWGKEKVAAGYMQEAYYCYAKWGANAKITHLEQNYPQLLGAILQPPTLAINHETTIASTLMRSFTNISSSKNLYLDFPAVMKAAQAISQEIELDKLLATLMQIAIATGGAQTGCLILRQQEQWLIVAQGNVDETKTLDIPLDEYQEIPQSLIYAVARSQEVAVFDCLSDAVEFAGDRYIISHKPKSVLCTPISQQGKLIGILYLENNLTVGAFTGDLLEVLKLICTQAAISLENAQLYHKLEARVAERTQQLTQKATQLELTLQELQRTQTQLIQSEKMSSLGQLVAGIAHEINNPVNFIHGNITHVKQYTEDLFNLVNLYQQSHPSQAEIPELLNEIDLDFIQEDLPQTLKSMQVGTERIREIVVSLRNFSRMDEAEFKQVDIHAGIDSTLMILQHRLTEKAERPAIEIIKDYGKLPKISCYAGQLNQVFMGILTNAIDAIEEKNAQQNLQGILENSQKIKIRTSVIDTNWIEIAIADNGIGMSDEVKQQIFNPFFTTKSVGKGTGMGMSISYQIITEKHGGKLKYFSTPNQGTEFVIQIPMGHIEL